MISIIICSINPVLLKTLSENIAITAGVPYEIISIDNRYKKYGLAQAYNYGAAQSTYSYLCFIHEDVRLLTTSWGNILINYLKNENTGLLGIAGSPYKSIIPSSWSVFPDLRIVNVVQQYKFSSKEKSVHIEKNTGNNFSDALVIDGVFMATRKTVWNQFQLDEKLLTGFHGYDIDFSLQVSQQYVVRVIFDIQVEHFSEGNQNKDWLEAAIKISNKWKHYLPASVIQLSTKKEQQLHIRALQVFTAQLCLMQYPFTKKIKWIFQFGFLRYPSLFIFGGILKPLLIVTGDSIARFLRIKR